MNMFHRSPIISPKRVERAALMLPAAFNAAPLIRIILLGATLSLTIVMTAFAQSYDPDLGAGNTAPPGITYGGGLRYEVGRGDQEVLRHHAEFLHHKARHHRQSM